jgi:hypothetical protein
VRRGRCFTLNLFIRASDSNRVLKFNKLGWP